jgi:hypothetical protein
MLLRIGLAALAVTSSSIAFRIGYVERSKVRGHGLPVMIVLGMAELARSVVPCGYGSTGGIFGPSLYIGGMPGGTVGMGAVFAGIVCVPVPSGGGQNQAGAGRK